MNTRGPDKPQTRLRRIGRQKAFLEALAQSGVVSHASRAARVSRRTVYFWREDATFRRSFNDAIEDANDDLVLEARRRALEGTRELLFDKNGNAIIDPRTGEPYVKMKASDRVLIRLLEAAFPETFGKKTIDYGFEKLSTEDLLIEAGKAGIYFGDPY